MLDRLRYYPNLLSFGVSTVAIGTFVVGCMTHQPEIEFIAYPVGSVGVLKLVTDVADFIDMKHNVIAEAQHIIDHQ